MSQKHLTIRPEPLSDDAEAVEGITERTGFFSEEEQRIARELIDERLALGPRSGYEFLFADHADQTVGYACFGRIPGTASSYDLYWIVVDPAHQGQGIGRALIASAERAVLERGGTQVYVETSSRPLYRPTRRFYEYVGYTQAATFEDFYAAGDDKVVYVKRLTPTALPR
jgi:GNAT superfamily N-acetyltransferase